jgi:predicted HAD superfamily hydrolase
MSKIYSFDVFDTLITRKVALPHHIFLLTGLRIRRELETGLEPQIFANARVQAEKEFSNSDDHSGGITKIYEYLAAALNVPDELKAQMLQIELETEAENIIPIEKNVELLEKLREESDQVIYISDMYLGENFITKILGDLGIHREGERVFVSCDYGAEKNEWQAF